MNNLIDLKEFTLPELEQLMAAWGQPTFRARQLVKWLYKGVRDFRGDDGHRPAVPGRAVPPGPGISNLRLEQVQSAADGCRKYLFGLNDGNRRKGAHPGSGPLHVVPVEPGGVRPGVPVLPDRAGRAIRNLKAGEIVDQVLAVRRELPPGAASQPGLHGHGGAARQFSHAYDALNMITAAPGG